MNDTIEEIIVTIQIKKSITSVINSCCVISEIYVIDCCVYFMRNYDFVRHVLSLIAKYFSIAYTTYCGIRTYICMSINSVFCISFLAWWWICICLV